MIAVSVGNKAASTQIVLTDAKGKRLLSYAPELSLAVVIFSSSEIASGESYTVTVGSQSRTVKAS